MKKRLLTLLLALTCMCSLVGCSAAEETVETVSTEEVSSETQEETTIEETTEEVTEETTESAEKADRGDTSVTTPSELSDDIYSFQISIDGTVYQFPMWASDFAALGWTYDGDATQTLESNQYTAAETWIKDDYSVYTKLANLSLNSVSFEDSMVAGITLEEYYLKDCDWEIILPKGIQYGVSTKEDIIAAYGEPNYEYDGDNWYKMGYEYDLYQSVYLYVSAETGVLCEIEIENIIELEGADNSVNAEVPEIVKGYTAPTAVGDDLYVFNIELEGNLYTLPCPVSVFLENGFTINENNSDSAFGAGNIGWVELRYNNQSYRCLVHNYADYATTAENCFVTSMESSIYDPDFDLTIPCGIKRGDSEESVLEILKNFNYEVETPENSEFTYYEVYDPDGSKLDGFTITTKGGEVVIIEVSNSQEPEY